jgi:hypothetical protein
MSMRRTSPKSSPNRDQNRFTAFICRAERREKGKKGTRRGRKLGEDFCQQIGLLISSVLSLLSQLHCAGDILPPPRRLLRANLCSDKKVQLQGELVALQLNSISLINLIKFHDCSIKFPVRRSHTKRLPHDSHLAPIIYHLNCMDFLRPKQAGEAGSGLEWASRVREHSTF